MSIDGECLDQQVIDENQILKSKVYFRLNFLRDNNRLYAPYDEYVKRLDYELGVFVNSGYSSLILIISDYIVWARKNGIVVGPGRGSAAGSLVVFLCEITTIDPMRFGLIFERFLNPSRISLPDIDTDFSDRDAIIGYLKEKYGVNRVVKAGVPSLFKPKSAIDEFGRVLEIPYDELKRINKLVTEDDFESSIKKNPSLANYKNRYPKLFDLAARAIGSVRQTSTHPSAVILTESPIGSEIPLARSSGSSGELVTQWDGEDLDYLGYVKLDILTVNNLSIISQTCGMLLEEEAAKFDIYDIDLDDKLTLSMFNEGHTIGVFQFEEKKSIEILKSLSDIKFFDLVCANALIRPGINVNRFVSSRNDSKSISYHIPELEPILSETFGVILFQEQVMKICVELAGFTLPEADKVRKIIGKTSNQKDPEGLNRVKEHFEQGYIQKGFPIDKFNVIWGDILACQTYIFNKCISGESFIYDCESSLLITIEEAYNKGITKTLSVNHFGKLFESDVEKIYDTGLQEVFRLELESGHVIEATADHKFFAYCGWVKLCGLCVGDEIACRSQEETDCLRIKFSKINSIKSMGIKQTFDMEIKHTSHNYLANGIVTHNSHATCYAYIAYVDMYLKSHYPIEFLCAAMRIKCEEKYITECARLNITVLNPDINKSEEVCCVENNCIRIGLTDVKNVGSCKCAISRRPYTDFVDIVQRSGMHQNTLESMLFAGCFDSLIERNVAHTHIFGDTLANTLLANKEKEMLGFYLSSNPLDDFKHLLSGCITVDGPKRPFGTIGGMILRIHKHRAKTGMMAFITLLVEDGEMDVMMWPSDYALDGNKIVEGSIIKGSCRITDRGGYSLKDIVVLRGE